MLGAYSRTSDESGYLLFLLHLPGNVLLDVRMIDINHHHLGSAPRRSPGGNERGRPIAETKHGDQSTSLTAAGQGLRRCPYIGKIRTCSRAELGDTRLVDVER